MANGSDKFQRFVVNAFLVYIIGAIVVVTIVEGPFKLCGSILIALSGGDYHDDWFDEERTLYIKTNHVCAANLCAIGAFLALVPPTDTLFVDSPGMDGSLFAALPPMPSVNRIELYRCRLDETFAIALTKMTGAEVLVIEDSDIEPGFFRELNRHPKLTYLALSNSWKSATKVRVADGAMEELDVARFESVALCGATAGEMPTIRGDASSKLKWISLPKTASENEFLEAMSIPSLRSIYVPPRLFWNESIRTCALDRGIELK